MSVEHTIIIEGDSGRWMHRVTPRRFLQFSRGLNDLIEANVARGQRQTRIQSPSNLPSGTLERLVLWIDQRVPSQHNLTFDELLGLSIVIWQYGCDPVIFRRLAASSPDQLMSGAEAAGWTFMALVFNWERDFRDASKMLVCDFSSALGVIEGAHYFPAILRDAVVTARRRLLRTTFGFVRNDVMRYARAPGPTFSHINHRLYAQGIDINLPGNEYVRLCTRNASQPAISMICSPEKLLDGLDDILRVPPQEGQPTEIQSRELTEQELPQGTAAGSSSSGSAHGAGSGRDARLSLHSESSDGQRIDTLRANGVNDGSIRRLVAGYFVKGKRQRDERKRVPLWSRDDVGHFQIAAGEIRGRIVSRRIELFDGCGLNIADFQDARRTQLIIPEPSPQHG